MVTFRCLCVILTLWMVSTRPSASILPGASVSGAWWGTPESRNIARKADTARRTGDFSGAASYYRQGYEDALHRHDERAAVGYLNGMAGCSLAQMDYRGALSSYLEAKTRAQAIGDQVDLGAIAVNLSVLYSQVYDFESAQKAAEDGRAAAATVSHAYFLPSLLMQLARLHEMRERSDGITASLYRKAIQAAKASGDRPLEALGLDLLGEYLLREERLGHRGHLDEARVSIETGLHLREQYSPKDLGYSWGWLGDLKLGEGLLAEAARFTDLALRSKAHVPEYLLKHQRGEIRLASGDPAGALADFGDAVALATHWRLAVLPANSFFTATNEELERRIFTSFIETAARQSLNGPSIAVESRQWAEKAFDAVELNRAASLRQSLVFSEAWHKRVPTEYWETLAKLRQIDSNNAGMGSISEESRRLRLELVEMEAKAGLGFNANNYESFYDQGSLIHFQHGLGRSEVLLSFHLGYLESYVWAVTRDSLRMYKLAAEAEIGAQISGLENAVRTGRPEAVELGQKLYGELFGQLDPESVAKTSWLLSLEGTLFATPFAALVTERKDGKVEYLVSQHSVQTIPGALLLSTRPEVGTGWFLGVGDPIYNVADPRWEGPKAAWLVSLFQSGPQFGRLVGSAQELSGSASNWAGTGTVLLEGPSARRDPFLKKLDQAPAVVHLATHVVDCGTQACLAFGLGKNGASEFLSTTDVAALRISGTIVAMTGCDSASGEVRAGSGLQGLTRAWQMAGAGAVLATSWPVRDTNGEIFSSFYKYLRRVPAAEALRLSQLDMVHSGTWRAAPAYWAAYQISGGSR